ncbi:MAG: sulfide/dihydroorotate dehydrogenase-like FAD/NAD-binding protein, partial [Rikenellaceae bacterium]|nr:sulfide/dihydroorotate dehydrogenase-like FAD/NAD-binding protein [Rikenellaceae bacterium]
MFKILKREELAENIVLTNVFAPRIAQSARPGQFVIVRADEKGERIPLTISDYNPEEGWITLVTQIVGESSRKICAAAEGESFANVAGPLGHPSEFIYENIEELKQKNILFIAGGLGTAPVYPQVKWLYEQGAPADVIVGAKSKELLIFQNEMQTVAKNLYVATDDGTAGFHGLVTDLMKDLIDNRGKQYDLVVAIGPMIMMKFVALATRPYGIKTIVSLNSLMVDGTGMCGACRVKVGDKIYFTCVDGPEFDGHLVDYDEAMRRQNMYKTLDSRIAKMEQERAEGHT